jgi:hypothetical protein
VPPVAAASSRICICCAATAIAAIAENNRQPARIDWINRDTLRLQHVVTASLIED